MVLAVGGNFAIVAPMTLLVLPLNALLGWVTYVHQKATVRSVNLRVRQNRRGWMFYLFCYQFVMAPVSLAGYVLEIFRTRCSW